MSDPDPSLKASHDLMELWLKAYEASYGKMIDVPLMGPTMENSERFRKHMGLTVDFYAAYLGSLASFQTVFMEATRKTQERVEEMTAEKGVQPSFAKDYYDLWMQTYSDTFKEFLNSPHFSSDLSTLTSRLMDYHSSSKELMEENLLKPLSLPTRREVDEMNREIYELKKKVKQMSKSQGGGSAKKS